MASQRRYLKAEAMVEVQEKIDGMAFYPGCSLDGLGKAYEKSAKAVIQDLGIQVENIKNYNCCGATEVKTVNYDLSVFLPARNLALAKNMGSSVVVAPCNGCVYSLSRANKAVTEDESTRQRINGYLGKAGVSSYDGSVEVKHLLEVIYQRAGPQAVRSHVKKPLSGLKVACYYGCLYTRPKVYTGAGLQEGKDNPEHPHYMDDLLEAAGATVVDFSAKTICCGGGHAVADREVSLGFSAAILNEATRAGADVVSTMCPLGHINIETNIPKIIEQYGDAIVRPVMYFTQLLGVAFGHSRKDVRLADNFSGADTAMHRLGF